MDAQILQMLLPKGIVVNTPDVYAEVAAHPVVPPEKLREYWQVYTTTFRKLIDPTAERLENFWWHVWGSDRRYLSGQTLARLYEEISEGQPFVPLRGPPNRFEGPVVRTMLRGIQALLLTKSLQQPRISQHESDRTVSEQSSEQRADQSAKQPEHPIRPPLETSQSDSQQAVGQSPQQLDESFRDRTSSALKSQPLHPILKKPRGPSASGPRPTARFVSPHDTEDEVAKDDGGSSSGADAVESSETQPPRSPIKAEKRAIPATKKFMVTTASKRRPVLPRRPSSQSSTGSEAGSRESHLSSALRHTATQRTIPPISEQQSGPDLVLASYESSASSGRAGRPALSAKAAGKRLAVGSYEKRSSLRGSSQFGERPEVIDEVESPTPRNQSPAENAGKSASSVQTSRGLVSDAGSSTVHGRSEGLAPAMMRSRSDNAYARPTMGRRPPQGLIASSVAATSNVAVRGTFDFETPNPADIQSSLSKTVPDSPGFPPDLVSRPSASSLLESRFTPTQPSPTPAVPLGRSKSQLTLLLEREKARIGDSRHRSAGQ